MPRLHHLFLAIVLASGLATSSARAQTNLTETVPPRAGAPHPHRFIDRFSAANTSHDGRLTLQQAEAGHMPWVARHFAAIDSQQKGYITLDDIRSYRHQLRLAGPGVARPQASAPYAHRFVERFNAANISHDGRLTFQQAQAAHMPWVTRNFAAIDVQQKGYITVQDVQAYRQQNRAAKSQPN